MENLVWLQFRNFPREFTNKDIKEFLSHFGSVCVVCGQKPLRLKEKGHAIAAFHNFQIAETVLKNLHQVKILQSRLSVKYYENNARISIKAKRKNKKEAIKDESLLPVAKLYSLYKKLKIIFDTNKHDNCQSSQVNASLLKILEDTLLNNQTFYFEVCQLLNKYTTHTNISTDIPEVENQNFQPILKHEPVIEDEDSEIEDDYDHNKIIPDDMREKIIKQRITLCKPPKIDKPNVYRTTANVSKLAKYMPPPPPRGVTKISQTAQNKRKHPISKDELFEKTDTKIQKNISISIASSHFNIERDSQNKITSPTNHAAFKFNFNTNSNDPE